MDSIRNIALAGHAGAGKTTLFEALLLASGNIQSAGSIERGNTVSDFDAQEKAHGHSIDTAIASIDLPSARVHLIDTPGYPDFHGPTLSALTAVETCAVVVNAANGIEHGTRRTMDYAGKQRLARMLVITRIDTEGAELAQLVADIQTEFGSQCLPINLPAGNGTAVVDCFFNPAGDADFSSVADAHQEILDQVVEINEKLMGRYLKARPLVLEPIVNVAVAIPAAHVGDVTGSLAAKRGRIVGTAAARRDQLLIKAQVPLAELGDYQTELKSVTGGEGRYSMELSHYEPVPPQVQKDLCAAWKPQEEDD